MGRLIDREAAIEAIRDLQLDLYTTQYIYSSDAIDAVKKQPAVDAVPDGGPNFMRGYGLGAKHVCDQIAAAPTIDAIPIKAISAWLAAYAAPPLYASDHVAALKNKVSIKTETERAEAWEYHWQHLVECGLMEVDDADKT